MKELKNQLNHALCNWKELSNRELMIILYKVVSKLAEQENTNVDTKFGR